MGGHSIRHIIAISFFLLPFWLSGQMGGVALTIKGDTVVFRCSENKLDSLYNEPFSIIHDFDSLKLSNAISSHSRFEKFANRWTFNYIGEKQFELRKPLDDFEEEYNPLDKYFVFADYWLYPRSEVDSSILISEIPYRVSEKGNTRFIWKGNKNARNVVLSGSFNHWDEHEIHMNKKNDGWEIELELEPGIYEYKFIVDGEWTHDTRNTLKLTNQHQTYNSILLIGEKITFSFNSKEKVRKVFLAGSFNNWDISSIPLDKNGNTWTTTLELPPGKHYYKFVVDRKWFLDPNNELLEVDNEGIKNSVLIIN